MDEKNERGDQLRGRATKQTSPDECGSAGVEQARGDFERGPRARALKRAMTRPDNPLGSVGLARAASIRMQINGQRATGNGKGRDGNWPAFIAAPHCLKAQSASRSDIFSICRSLCLARFIDRPARGPRRLFCYLPESLAFPPSLETFASRRLARKFHHGGGTDAPSEPPRVAFKKHKLRSSAVGHEINRTLVFVASERGTSEPPLGFHRYIIISVDKTRARYCTERDIKEAQRGQTERVASVFGHGLALYISLFLSLSLSLSLSRPPSQYEGSNLLDAQRKTTRTLDETEAGEGEGTPCTGCHDEYTQLKPRRPGRAVVVGAGVKSERVMCIDDPLVAPSASAGCVAHFCSQWLVKGNEPRFIAIMIRCSLLGAYIVH